MLKQILINKYFYKLSTGKFFKNDDDAMIGRAKDVIHNLKDNIEYLNILENDDLKEDIININNETIELIKEINRKYFNKNNVIGLFNHPMAGFYVLQEKGELYEYLKEYYDELKEEQNGNKYCRCKISK